MTLVIYSLHILAGIVSSITRFGLLVGIIFVCVMRIDVYSVPEWITSVYYFDSFKKAYYSIIIIQNMHNHPMLVTFNEILFSITTRVQSDKRDLSDNEREEINR